MRVVDPLESSSGWNSFFSHPQENLLNRVPTASLTRLKHLENLTLDTNLIIELNNEAFLGRCLFGSGPVEPACTGILYLLFFFLYLQRHLRPKSSDLLKSLPRLFCVPPRPPLKLFQPFQRSIKSPQSLVIPYLIRNIIQKWQMMGYLPPSPNLNLQAFGIISYTFSKTMRVPWRNFQQLSNAAFLYLFSFR